MNQNKLIEILHKHQLWLNGKAGGERADLSNADLRYADLYGANLRGVNLSGANLDSAIISKNNILRLCNEILWFNVKCNKFRAVKK